MLTDDDKKWIAAQISASEERIGARVEKFEATLIAEFRKWKLPENNDPRIDSAALRTMDLELEALQCGVDKLEKE